MPGLIQIIESVDLFSSEGVDGFCVEIEGSVFLLGEGFSSAVSEQLMEGDNDEEGGSVILDLEVLVILSEVLDVFSGRGTIDISEVHVLESEVFPDLIVVRDIDSDRSSGAGEGENLEGGEIWLGEFIRLE